MANISQVHIPGKIGFGLMGFTWRAVQTPDEQAFEVIKTAIAQGSTFLNGGEFYGAPDPLLNLKLLQRFLAKYPDYKDKFVLSIKGGINFESFHPDGSKEGIARSIENILKYIPGKLDLFECARVDKNVPIEETISYIAEYVKAGKVKGISLSEVNADTIRRAHKVFPISAVEVEFSLFSTEILTNGVAKTCAELNIPIIAYSPLSRGFLTDQIKKRDDIPPQLLLFDRFNEENFPKNLKLAEKIKEIAKKKGITPAQLAINWILYYSGKHGQPTIIPIPGSTTVDRVLENTKIFELNVSDIQEIDSVLKSFTVSGGRYFKDHEQFLSA